MANDSKPPSNLVIDPVEAFGKLLSEWEKTSNDLANQMMGTDQFNQSMGSATSFSLKMREAMHEQMTRMLELSNMPSREEVSELTRLVSKIDQRLDRIERQLGSQSAEGARQARPRPPRTKQPSKDKG